jgi:tRNA modification GTPase
VLVVLDGSQPASDEDKPLLAQVEQRTAIVVENKADLVSSDLFTSSLKNAGGHDFSRSEKRHKKNDSEPASAGEKLSTHLRTSALTGEGIAELRAAILQHVTGDAGSSAESGFLTNARHQSLVRDSLTGLTQAGTAVQNRVPHEMLLLDLYSALRPLDEITGATTNDDILNLIFSRFCIGK